MVEIPKLTHVFFMSPEVYVFFIVVMAHFFLVHHKPGGEDLKRVAQPPSCSFKCPEGVHNHFQAHVFFMCENSKRGLATERLFCTESSIEWKFIG